jgi:ParB/RepB/Spo0J family partition protein
VSPRPLPKFTLAEADTVGRLRPPVSNRATHALPVDCISPSPRNPRTAWGDLDELAASLDTHGLLQPIVVRPEGAEGRYEIVAGHRRFAAAQKLDWRTIDAVVRKADPSEAFILTLVENLQRDDLSPKEEAAGLEILVRENNWSTHQVAAAVKRSQKYVSSRLRVFDDELLAPYVLTNRLSVSAAEEILPMRSKRDFQPASEALVERAVVFKWNRADVREEVAKAMRAGQLPRGFSKALDTVVDGLREAQPGALSSAHLRKLQQIFLLGRDYERFEKRKTTRDARRNAPVVPTISAMGRAYIPDQEAN